MKQPTLKYLEPMKPYVQLNNASKYAWACVLTQSGEHKVNWKKSKILHPITYKSSLFVAAK